ncbi:BURP domain-containing protein 11-like [Pyrus ussuriensis x Pyrus communis]|uniref:BURP domain-containing protein 11-like n=1 Tax=Pyrus ussuriensis x Pyrus communis TaxID=2448454 RepID=A0A5N5I7I3_9ROSA|nr:BURP domain-containing protein 11-like [Pyrus ussuriensis x Pyrus communis]
MASRFIIIFCLLFVLCRYATGARDVVKQQYKIGHGATKSMKEVETPYTMSYATKESKKEVKTPYTMSYAAKEEVLTPYTMSYATKEGKKEAETPYTMSYATKEEVKTPYIMSYATKEGKKEVETPYAMSYATKGSKKAVETPYAMNYATKERKEEVETPYTMSYATKEAGTPYITGYRTKEAETPYTMSYATKEAESPYIMGYRTKEAETPYTMSYATKEGKKEVETPYKMSYGTEEVEPSHEHVHIHMHPQSQPHMDHNEASKQGFFTFDDLHCGMRMPLHFPNQEHSRFLPKEVADSIPFSTPHIPQIRQLFSIPQGSQEAKNVAYALEQCEMKPIKGETKFCATSLESMTNFVTKIIGSGVRFNILSTEHPTTSTSITQSYTILEEPKQVLASKMVFCHPLAYPYAVFFCHHFEKDTKFFKVKLGGENGDKVQAVAVCHMDTSDWDPAHSLFALLGIKASASSPVCHFLPENHLVWIPSPATSAI